MAVLLPYVKQLFFAFLALVVLLLVLMHPAESMTIITTAMGTVWNLAVDTANQLAALVKPSMGS